MDQINETKPPMTYRKKGLRIGKIILLILIIAFVIYIINGYYSSGQKCYSGPFDVSGYYHCSIFLYAYPVFWFSAVFFWWWVIPLVLLIPMAIGWIMDKKRK
jgi:hypothetical protein